MIDPARFVAHLGEQGISFYTGVPDSLLKSLNSQIMGGLPRAQHVIAANEGGAVGIAIGHYLRTGRPAAVYLQNSGFGNLVNPLLSLADPDVYGVPMLVIIGWRGQPGVKDEPQHVKQGRVMTSLLDALDLPWSVLPQDPAGAERRVAEAVATAVARSSPYLLLVEKGTFGELASRSGDSSAEPSTMPAQPASAVTAPSREEALVALAEAVGDDAVIVSTTGMLSRELFEHRTGTGSDGGRDFLTVGGMGHACSIALGIAMAAAGLRGAAGEGASQREPDREVWCFDGDGALLMHLGSLAVIADHAPPGYFHVVFNNGVHDSVGGQPTSIGTVDIPATARALGYRYAAATDDPTALAKAVAELRAHGGPSLLELRVRPGSRPDLGRPTRTPAQSKQAFMAAVRE
jgi:phosphonopyruvate decarboxylase